MPPVKWDYLRSVELRYAEYMCMDKNLYKICRQLANTAETGGHAILTLVK